MNVSVGHSCIGYEEFKNLVKDSGSDEALCSLYEDIEYYDMVWSVRDDSGKLVGFATSICNGYHVNLPLMLIDEGCSEDVGSLILEMCNKYYIGCLVR